MKNGLEIAITPQISHRCILSFADDRHFVSVWGRDEHVLDPEPTWIRNEPDFGRTGSDPDRPYVLDQIGHGTEPVAYTGFFNGGLQ